MSLEQDNAHLAVVQTLVFRLRREGPLTVSEEEFAAVREAVRLMSDVPDAPAMPETRADVDDAVAAVNAVMWRQIKLAGKIADRVLEEWVALGSEEAERRARQRVAELDGAWARASAASRVDTEIRIIREDMQAGMSLFDIQASEAILDAARGSRRPRDYKEGFELIIGALPDRIRERDKLGALNLAGELALSAGLFPEAVKVLTRLISEEERLQKSYYREGAAAMRAYAFVELGDGASAMADIEQVEDDLQMFWIDNVPMLTKAYLLKKVRELDAGVSSQCAAPPDG
ncbi:hypothetical protein [Iodidimonas sp. SYSU 1G8]|uniref:hypothetical protein n=1 Tax=Iodidimonas sp. SYSU 1G8 TaxID=3133967 RepID=UPI0031FF0277